MIPNATSKAFGVVLITTLLGSCHLVNRSEIANVDHDTNTYIRNQGGGGNCVSFGIVGLLENNLYQKTGVAVDLSERYFMYAAMIEYSEFYNVNEHMIYAIAEHGMVPEADFPYQKVLKPAFFDLSKQVRPDQPEPKLYMEQTTRTLRGFAEAEYLFEGGQNQNVTSYEAKLSDEGLETVRKKRQKFLSQPTYFGKIPKQVSIPVNALRIDAKAKIPLVDQTPCFQLPGENSIKTQISPVDFAEKCLLFDFNNYHARYVDIGEESQRYNPSLLEKLLDQGSVAAIGAYQYKPLTAVHSVREEPFPLTNPHDRREFIKDVSGGHAMLLTGYLAKNDIDDPKEHDQGILKDDYFEIVNLRNDLNLDLVREKLVGPLYEGPSNLQINLAIQSRNRLKDKFWRMQVKIDKEKRVEGGLNKNYTVLARELKGIIKLLDDLEDKIFKLRLALLGSKKAKKDYQDRFNAFRRSFKHENSKDSPFIVKKSKERYQAVLREKPDWVIKSVAGYNSFAHIKDHNERLRKISERRQKSFLYKFYIEPEGGVFIIRNSWGIKDTSIRGFVLYTYEYFKRYTDELVWHKPNQIKPFK